MAYYMRRNRGRAPTTKAKEEPGGTASAGAEAASTARKKGGSLQASVRKADKAFSRYVRLRDSMKGGVCRCIACGRVKPVEKMDCGHYFSRRHMATRYDEDNCHAECSYCNRFNAEHLDGYRANLIRKIGEQRFALLELRHVKKVAWSRFELEAMAAHYKKVGDRLAKEKGLEP